MRNRLAAVLALVAVTFLVPPAPGQDAKEPFPRFKMQEIETGLKVGYAVVLEDLSGDGKKDIIVVDTTRVVWYENPSWKRRVIIEGQTKPDNVCLAAHDIDGDGKVDLALGSGWKGASSEAQGPLQWLRRGKTLDEPWTLHPIGDEPSVHRIRFADLDGDGKPELVSAPLLGHKSTKAKNWMDQPVRVTAYKIPKDPTRDRWEPEIVDQGLHVIHNFWPVAREGGKGLDLLMASYEGVTLLARGPDGKWARRHLGEGNQANPQSNRGASEIKQGQLKGGRHYIATIEPWHGHQVVVYTPPPDGSQKLWDRHLVDEQLRWGHGVWCADLDGDGEDELIIGVRDDLGKKAGERRGVRLYKATEGKGAKWVRQIIDDGGVAVEDLAAADLDGDGRIDIVAVGRQTGNARIYWNEGMKK